MTELPAVSVVMPVRNEAAFIATSLGAVLAQDYPSDLVEVLVIDGCSDDDTVAIAERTSAGASVRVRVLRNDAKITPPALNLGIAQATGDVIVRVDGHCEIAPDYVRRCVDALRTSGADEVGGAQRAAAGDGVVASAIAAAVASPLGSGNAAYRDPGRSGYVETVYLGAFRRDVFERIGGYDEELIRAEDGELNLRLLQAGGRIWLDPSIVVTYHPRTSLPRLWRQYFEYGVYKVRFMQKRGGFSSPRQLVPPLFVLGLLATLLAAVATTDARYLFAVAGPYAVVVLAASLFAGRRAPATIGVLPAVFTTMHLAWGIGFLAGLWRWRTSFSRSNSEAIEP